MIKLTTDLPICLKGVIHTVINPLAKWVFSVFNIGQTRPLFVYFRPFIKYSTKLYYKNVDGVIGMRTWDHRSRQIDSAMATRILCFLLGRWFEMPSTFWNVMTKTRWDGGTPPDNEVAPPPTNNDLNQKVSSHLQN